MSGRTFVLIFFFWAVLAVVTPALVLLSESSKPDIEFGVEKSGANKARKMMDYQTQKHSIIEAPVGAPSPAPALQSVILRVAKDHLIRRFSKRK
ncbi:hypothetical protein K2173_007472 [Erythroxylum novogranatense]|uniref:Transmembrane protein n=1 Tax=Erythroxylum novogranatense TaxID=1862640 RepID=A0AAV8T7X0_9ROSI|nr:hypothetical protein K2173_007472 [Erythroxylum novogranatense]